MGVIKVPTSQLLWGFTEIRNAESLVADTSHVLNVYQLIFLILLLGRERCLTLRVQFVRHAHVLFDLYIHRAILKFSNM